MKKYKVFEMLKRSQNLKYRLAINSLIVGILVGLTIVAHRIIISKLSPIFLNIYKNGRHNFIIVPFIFLTLIALGYIVGKCLKKQPMISGSGIPQVEGILTRNLKINWFSVLFYKFVGGLICLCAGLSVGREGPSVQMGACIGEGVSKNLKNLDNEEKYVPDTNFKGWIYTIMRNIFINNYRKIVRDQTFVDTTDNYYHLNLPQDSGFESTEGAYDLKEMHRIVNALPREYKIPFSMHVSGFKYREIAEKLGLPLGTVKSRIFFTRQRLQQELKDFV